ncbi:MAG: hypothetical protein K2N73_16755, partial [Lachnospiraceae bacterium]|nr:hypothetical protein [Lachnospiraceae bacterium]
DFYYAPHFATDLAVAAKSCLNINLRLLLFTPFQQQVKIHAKFASQMDFYYAPHFATDLAVAAKSCLNINLRLPVYHTFW